MFTNEYAVEINLSNGAIASFFLDKNFVKINGSANSGYVPVNFVQSSGNEITVLLPKEALEHGTRWVRVSREQVVT